MLRSITKGRHAIITLGCILVMVCFSSLLAFGQQGNLLINPGFEEQIEGQMAPGWTPFSVSQLGEDIAFLKGQAHSGEWSFAIYTAQRGIRSVRFPAEPGVTYRASVMAKAETGSIPVLYLDFENDNYQRVLHKSINTKKAEWTELSVSLEAPPNAVWVSVILYLASGAQGTAHFDDVTLVALRPFADAGPDQRVRPGTRVVLDGSGSFEPDGKPLTYSWTMTSKPEGSGAELESLTSAQTGLTVDIPGVYKIQLIVNDGDQNSKPSTVTVIAKEAPIANPGPDRVVRIGTTVQLDGSGSSEREDDSLTYAWRILSKPKGSGAVLDDPTHATPSFFADEPGNYQIELIVNDGLGPSAPAVVTITAKPLPVANAGPDRYVGIGSEVKLDGTGSHSPDGLPLTYMWTLDSKPEGSVAELVDADQAEPTFVADKPGAYRISLVVNDGLGVSEPSHVTVIATDQLVAHAGKNQIVRFGERVTLDGTGSFDPQGNPLQYEWTLRKAPEGSTAQLEDATSATPSFVPDQTGTYEIELVVRNGIIESEPASVSVRVKREPVATFTVTPEQGLTTETLIEFSGTATADDANIVTWVWDFGNGTVSREQNPTHRYIRAGVYHVTLRVTDSDGFTSELAHKVLAIGSPQANVVETHSHQTGPGDDTFDLSGPTGISLVKYGPGTPLITVATFAGNPDPDSGPLFAHGGTFFDLNLSSTDDVDAIDFTWHFGPDVRDEGLVLKWFDPGLGQWVAVQPQTVQRNPEGGGTITVRFDASSSPRVDQLTGTLFGAGVNVLPQVTILAPMAGAVWSGQHEIRWSATPGSGGSDNTLTIDLFYAPANGNAWTSIATGLANSGTYLWDTKQVATAGPYRVKVAATDSYGARSEAESEVFSIAKAPARLTHGPNPASDSVTFYFPEGAAGTLYVFDAAGRHVWSATVQAGDSYLGWNLVHQNGSRLANGLYLYRFVANDGSRSEIGRLVVRR